MRCSFGSAGDCVQDANGSRDGDAVEAPIEMSSDAIVLFRLLLESNAARIAQGTHKPGTSGTINSFLLPLNKLTPKDIASVCKDVGCSVCGNPVKSRCSRCQSIGYCGTGMVLGDLFSLNSELDSCLCRMSEIRLEAAQVHM